MEKMLRLINEVKKAFKVVQKSGVILFKLKLFARFFLHAGEWVIIREKFFDLFSKFRPAKRCSITPEITQVSRWDTTIQLCSFQRVNVTYTVIRAANSVCRAVEIITSIFGCNFRSRVIAIRYIIRILAGNTCCITSMFYRTVTRNRSVVYGIINRCSSGDASNRIGFQIAPGRHFAIVSAMTYRTAIADNAAYPNGRIAHACDLTIVIARTDIRPSTACNSSTIQIGCRRFFRKGDLCTVHAIFYHSTLCLPNNAANSKARVVGDKLDGTAYCTIGQCRLGGFADQKCDLMISRAQRSTNRRIFQYNICKLCS